MKGNIISFHIPGFILNQPLFSVLAMSMLPDGAETQLDDWTIFFLNQTSFNTISPVLALDTPEATPVPLPGEDNGHLTTHRPELLCVLNLVRTKHDKSLNRFVLFLCTSAPRFLLFFLFFSEELRFLHLQFAPVIPSSRFSRSAL